MDHKEPTPFKEPAREIFSLEADEFLKRLESMGPDEIEELATAQALVVKAKNTSRSLMEIIDGNVFLRAFKPLLELPAEPRSWMSVFLWWEARRVLYNILIFVCSLGVVAASVLGLLSPDNLLWGAVEYAIMANLCYSCGFFAEVLARNIFGEQAKHFAPIAFTLGTIFAMSMTLFCSFIALLLSFFLILRII